MIYVVLISFQRPQQLERCLISLSYLQPLDYKFCVHINGDDEESKGTVKKFKPYLSLFSSEQHTLSEARNHLLEKIMSESNEDDWILFLDDDAFLPEGYGLEVKNIFAEAEKNKVDMIGGPNLTPPTSSFFSKLSGEWLASQFVSGEASLRYKQGRKKIMNNDDGLILCHLWVKVRALRNRRFHKFIKGGEENLFFNEFFKSHLSCYYDPKLFVFHERRKNFSDFICQIFKYGHGRGQVILYSGRLRPMHLIPVFFLLYSGSLILNALQMNLVYFVPGCIYIFLLFVETLRIIFKLKNIKAFLSIFAVPLLHWTYALGLLFGVVRKHPCKT